MIDTERWILTEAWLANGLRLVWAGYSSPSDKDESWQEDEAPGRNRRYRYAGYGEWEVLRPNNFLSRPYGEDHSPELSTSTMRHELGHYLTSSQEQRGKPNFGLKGNTLDDGGAEDRAIAAERVIQSITRASSRILSMALHGEKP